MTQDQLVLFPTEEDRKSGWEPLAIRMTESGDIGVGSPDETSSDWLISRADWPAVVSWVNAHFDT